MQRVLHADRFDVFQHRGAAAAHQLHRAAKSVLAECQHGFDGVGRLQRHVVKHEVRLACGKRLAQRATIGKLDRVDAGAVHDQRQEVPDARLLVDQEAQRCAGFRGIGACGFRRR